MYDFSVDVRGENEESNENENDDVPSESLAEVLNARNAVSVKEKSSLFDSLPTLPSTPNLQIRKHNSLDFSDTYLITNNRHVTKNKYTSSAVDAVMSKSSMKTGLEKEYAVPFMSEKMLKLNRKKLREKTKGEKWYNLPAAEVTDEVKNDLQILQMRSVLDKNHFYKKNDIKHTPKYFQFGTVVENSADFYSGRIVKAQRRKTLVDELLADAGCKSYQKKKYKEIMDTSRRKNGPKSLMSQKTNDKATTRTKKKMKNMA